MTEEIVINEKSLQAVLKRYDELEQENKELKIKLSSTKCYLCGEGFLTPEGAELYEEKENYRSALEEILESAKFAQCLPCGSGNLEDCLNCDDDTTNNGQFCMEKRIHENANQKLWINTQTSL